MHLKDSHGAQPVDMKVSTVPLETALLPVIGKGKMMVLSMK